MSPAVLQVAIFDLDGTLTWRDSFVQFLSGYIRRRPGHWLRLLRLVPALTRFALRRDRGLLKQRIIQALMRGDTCAEIDAWAREFAGKLTTNGMRRDALEVLHRHSQRGDYLVLLSASPDLYVPHIGALLGIARVVCTEFRVIDGRLDGALVTANRRGREKLLVLASLRAEFPRASFAAYGNAASDLPHLEKADQPLLVNANAVTRKRASKLGINNTRWK